MNQYARATIVQPMANIRRKRVLPTGGEIVVNVGQEVKAMQVLARTPLSSSFHVVSVSDALGVDPTEVKEYLLVESGVLVGQGTPLAERKRLFGLRQVMSPFDGMVAAVNRGRIVLEQTTDWLELRAMVPGRVVNQIGDRGVMLEVKGARVQGVWACGDVATGQLACLSASPEASLLAEQVTSDLAQQIIAVGWITDEALLAALVDAGAVGAVVGSMSADLCDAAVSLNFPVLLTEGIGRLPLAQPIFELLRELDGEDISLFTEYAPERGERPEAILPLAGMPSIDAPTFHRPLAPGKQVRILRPPYQQQVGEIVRVQQHMDILPNGAQAAGVVVKLPDGQQVFVAMANLDIII